MMSLLLRVVRLSLLTAVSFEAVAGSAVGSIDPKWAADSIWDQGKAEVLLYKTREMREGALRDGEAVDIIVKEDHLTTLNVKADNWKQPNLLPRLKFNHVLTIPTGMYTYHQMLSVFFDRGTLQTKKAVFSSQEWCGQTFKELHFDDPLKAVLDFSSYWDGEGKGRKEMDVPKDTVPYNALPVWMRALPLAEKSEFSISLFSDLISNKVGRPNAFSAKVRVRGKESVSVLGKATDAFAVDVEWKEGSKKNRDRYWFSTEALHPMLRREKWDGSVYELRKRLVDDYWKHNLPGDEKRLQ